tara:strand:+ start:1614 stop:1823 length:210 start_codon:yes stop_codon:yes gene_type:complete
MRVGDLVRPKEDAWVSTHEKQWVGVIIDFHTDVDNFGDPQERYAVVCWNDRYPAEEEYPESLEVVNESR